MPGASVGAAAVDPVTRRLLRRRREAASSGASPQGLHGSPLLHSLIAALSALPASEAAAFGRAFASLAAATAEAMGLAHPATVAGGAEAQSLGAGAMVPLAAWLSGTGEDEAATALGVSVASEPAAESPSKAGVASDKPAPEGGTRKRRRLRGMARLLAENASGAGEEAEGEEEEERGETASQETRAVDAAIGACVAAEVACLRLAVAAATPGQEGEGEAATGGTGTPERGGRRASKGTAAKRRRRALQQAESRAAPAARVREGVVAALRGLFGRWGGPPAHLALSEAATCHEVAGTRRALEPRPRAALLRALGDPSYYLGDGAEAVTSPLLQHDTCVAFAFLQRAGRALNLRDWSDAFAAALRPTAEAAGAARGKEGCGESLADAEVETELRARFVRAAHELQHVGLVTAASRKHAHAHKLAFALEALTEV